MTDTVHDKFKHWLVAAHQRGEIQTGAYQLGDILARYIHVLEQIAEPTPQVREAAAEARKAFEEAIGKPVPPEVGQTRMSAYDSTADTLRHIRRVQQLLGIMARSLMVRGEVHDDSKLGPEEKPLFDEMTPLLKTLTYGSDEYKASLEKLGGALRHHYAANSHHPEHYENGVSGMNLLDVVEMFCDWKAASERTKDGDFAKSIEIGVERFKIEPQLANVLRNTLGKV